MKIKKMNRGFTLVELMIVVAIIGVLAALAIYGVRKYLSNAKTAEAKENIGRLSQDAASRFTEPKIAKGLMAAGDSATYSNTLCDSATAPVPANLADVANSKYQSQPTDWASGTELVGWKCLGFSMEAPQIYRYNYTTTGTTDVGSIFTTTAEGDLDGDNDPSTFRRQGEIIEDSAGISIKLSPSIEETNPEE